MVLILGHVVLILGRGLDTRTCGLDIRTRGLDIRTHGLDMMSLYQGTLLIELTHVLCVSLRMTQGFWTLSKKERLFPR